MKRFKLVWLLTLMTIMALPSLSILRAFSENDACPEIVREALTTSKELCDGTGRNQACYGHVSLEAQPQPDIDDFAFDDEGDIVDLVDLQALRLEGMDIDAGIWGVAMLRLQASLPDTEPEDKNVTVLLFGDVEVENGVDEENAHEYKPMQAFYFRSASEDSECTQAPESGMVVQTPEGVAEVTLLINEVNVELGSTVFFQTQEDGDLTVRVVEGKAHVEGMGKASTAFAGSELSVPIDADMRISGPPTDPKPYKTEKVEPLPLELLEREITVPPPLTEDEIEQKEKEATSTWESETITPTVTSTSTVVPSFTPSRTYTPRPTFTPLPTWTPLPTFTYTPLPTWTLLPTFTYTPLPTWTLLPTDTDTPLPSETPDEEIPTDTDTPLPTDTPTEDQVEPGDDSSLTPTDTASPTATDYDLSSIPERTPSETPTPTPTETGTVNYSSLDTPEATQEVIAAS